MPNPGTTLVVDDDISRTLNKYTPAQLLEIVENLRPLSESNPAQARQVLANNADLTYAVVQSMLLMGLVDEEVVLSLTDAARRDSSAPGRSASPAAAAPAPAPQTVEQRLAALDPQQAAMVRQVLALQEEHIAALPAEQQTMIRQIKRDYA